MFNIKKQIFFIFGDIFAGIWQQCLQPIPEFMYTVLLVLYYRKRTILWVFCYDELKNNLHQGKITIFCKNATCFKKEIFVCLLYSIVGTVKAASVCFYSRSVRFMSYKSTWPKMGEGGGWVSPADPSLLWEVP